MFTPAKEDINKKRTHLGSFFIYVRYSDDVIL
jgi:hypothetical protein